MDSCLTNLCKPTGTINCVDLVSVPDFPSGAMENWGIITFRETRILYNENTTAVQNAFDVVNTVAHEIAHQVSWDFSNQSTK